MSAFLVTAYVTVLPKHQLYFPWKVQKNNFFNRNESVLWTFLLYTSFCGWRTKAPQTCLTATWGLLKGKPIPIDSHVKMPNFCHEHDYSLVQYIVLVFTANFPLYGNYYSPIWISGHGQFDWQVQTQAALGNDCFLKQKLFKCVCLHKRGSPTPNKLLWCPPRSWQHIIGRSGWCTCLRSKNYSMKSTVTLSLAFNIWFPFSSLEA